ncbi:hypothetical protein Mterra_01824 [Calidithermus terrae]|uniref:DUF11 domain-containing protein n=1 Tax=Calidithermus terrae TaxID=1408545 RepID=A0A399EN07_9DEIN|nr:DUF11 domain-containing protein [Calidithermus terrae]RIH85006.1 hypothetical protein Mterra_01824 [Calidithermus terrae]
MKLPRIVALLLTLLGPLSLAQTNFCSNAGGTRSGNLFALDGTFGTAPAGTQSPTLTSSSNPVPVVPPTRYALGSVPGISGGVDAQGRPIGTTTYNLNPRTPTNFPGNYSPEDGEYEITNSSYNRQDGAWHRFIGGRNGGGERDLFMFINAAFTAGVFYEQTLTVTPNSNYEFSISVINLIANNASILPNLNLEIDRQGVDDNNDGTIDEAGESQVIALTGNIPNTSTPIWREYGGVINSGASNRITVRFRNNAPGGGGNDLAIDNLQFTTCIGLPTGNISGTVYLDANASNALDPGEALGDSIAVELVGRDSNNNPVVVATAQTVNGVYSFTNVPAGTYTIRIPLNDPQLNASTPRNPSTISGGYVVRDNVQLPVNGNLTGLDFGFQLPPISITKTANANSTTDAIGSVITTATVGTTFQYTFRVTNNTGANLSSTALRLIDALPAGLTYVQGSLQMALVTGNDSPTFTNVADGGTYPFAEPNGRPLGRDVGGSTTSFDNGRLNSGESLFIRFRVTVNSNPPAIITNQGRITYTAGSVSYRVLTDDPNVAGLADPTLVRVGPNLAVTKVASVSATSPDSSFTYTLTISNNGGVATTSATLTDVLPAGLSYVPNTAEAALGLNPTSFTNLNASSYPFATGRPIGNNAPGFNNGTLAPGQTLTLRFQVQVATSPLPPGSLSNQATVNFSGGPAGGVLSDDPAIAGPANPTVTPVNFADLTLSKTHSGNFVRGSTGVYTLTVSNIGQAASAGTITVTDTLPAGLTFASATGWSCTVSSPGPPQTVTCTSPGGLSIPVGGSASFTLNVGVSQGAASSLTNTASVSGGAENNTANNGTSDPTVVESRADVRMVSKAADNANPVQGTNVTFTLTVRNDGPSNATGVQVTDLLPVGLSFVSSVPSQGSYTAGTGVWTVGNLASGTSATLQITATATQVGNITNTATKTAQTEPDPNTGNNQAQVTITVVPPGVSVSGHLYHDLQPNSLREPGEDWSGGTSVYVNLVQGGSVVQSVSVSVGTGSFSFSGVAPGSYALVVTGSASSTTPAPPSGWLFIEPVAGSRSLSVGSSDVPGQDFGLYHGSRVSGTVFRDDGLGSGTANDALQNGGEPGIAGVAVTASDGAQGRVTVTDSLGNYVLYVPYTFGPALTLSHPLAPATGSNVGGSSAVLASAYGQGAAQQRTISPFAAGNRYDGYNFGVVRPSLWQPDQSGQASSPGVVTYAHRVRPGTLGTLTFLRLAGGWNYLLRLDANCDGDFADAGEGYQGLPYSLAVGSAWPREADGSLRACAVEVMVIVPAGLPGGSSDFLNLASRLRYAGNAAVDDQLALTDTTVVGAGGELRLTKQVQNLTQGTPPSTGRADGRPGEVLEYCIAYQNQSASPVTQVVLTDPIPFFTDYQAGTLRLGASPLTDAADADAGEVSGGLVRVRIGTLAAGAGGQVCYRVKIR